MTTEVVARPSTVLAIADDQTEFNEAQVAVLRHAGVENAGREDLAVFFHQCKRTGLDPFAKQIYMIGRNSKNPRTQQWETKYTIQTGIDGYRLIADRAAAAKRETFGYEDTLWADAEGKWHDVWLGNGNPTAAKVVVVKDGGRRFPAIATWSEYVQTDRNGNPNSMWSRMGANQLAKCAEALALRKAYPQDLSGIYTAEEMGQADNDTGQWQQPAQRQPQQSGASAAQRLAAAAAQPVDPQTGDTAAEVDWIAELELAGDDVDAIKAIWRRARSLKADDWVIDAINAAGQAAAANKDTGEIHESEIVEEEKETA